VSCAQRLDLSQNKLKGKLDDALAVDLLGLKHVNLSGNTKLEGDICAALGKATGLEEFMVISRTPVVQAEARVSLSCNNTAARRCSISCVLIPVLFAVLASWRGPNSPGHSPR